MNIDITSNLTPDEKELFDSLRSIVQEVAPGTSLRVAGGWVRDKIMGKLSDDIDFMVDNMSGEKMARLITQKMGLQGPHVIEANPDASKHLETAGVKIPISNGTEFDLDFAMARQEVYNDESRIPEIKPASPQEDAMRRDLTINSLFYNIMNGELEDFTGKGIDDLSSMTIRTPEDPLKTFQDDPLRIFRTIRFTSRYNGNIDEETLAAMNDPSLRASILQKVKKERIQEELNKTLKGPNPLVAVNLLKSTGILEDIIGEAIKGSEFEGKMAPFDMDQNNPHHELTVWDHTVKVIENILMYYPDTDPEKRAIMILTALMHDLGKLYYEIHEDKGDKTSYSGHEKASGDISKLILQYLKFNNNTVEQVSKMSKHHMRIHQVERDDQLAGENKRLSYMRRFIRKMLADNVDAMDLMNHTMADAYSKSKGVVSPEVVRKYQLIQSQMQQALSSMNVDPNKKKFVPILNGREIMSVLNINPGPMVGQVNEFLQELMDEDPNMTKDQAAEKIKAQFSPQLDTEEINRQASACPKHLLFTRLEEILEAIEEKNGHQAISLMLKLKDEAEDDESVFEHVASCLLQVLSFDKTQKNLDLMDYVFEKAEKNFFNVKLCVPVVGILLLMKTGTEDEVIERILKRMSNMAKNELQDMLKSLPKDAHHKKLIKRFLNG
jgi:tRNA nucleotidyltransferase (CCA-adding enzyme)